MTADEIRSMLDAHARRLRGESDGKRADLRGADLSVADLSRAKLDGGVTVRKMRALVGLYEYAVYLVLAEDGTPWLRMGCHWYPLSWYEDHGGVRGINLSEYPDDGSPKSERRIRAYEYARQELLAMVAEHTATALQEPARSAASSSRG